MTDWDYIENMLLGEDDPEREELERSIPNDGPAVRAFYGLDKSLKERLIAAVKFLPLVFGFAITSPFWLFYFLVYEEYLLPLWWRIEDWWELIQWEHDHMPVEQHIPMTDKQKRELIVTGLICIALLIIIIYLYYLMES